MTDSPAPATGLAAHLAALATDLTTATQQGDQPAPVTLAHTCRGFLLAGAVSGLLDHYALPRRDTFAVCAEACERAVALLYKVLGEQLIRRYAHSGEQAVLLRHGRDELLDSIPEDVDRIAAAMITLAAALHSALAPLLEQESLPPTIRGAARMAADAATIVHSHCGGDSGGW